MKRKKSKDYSFKQLLIAGFLLVTAGTTIYFATNLIQNKLNLGAGAAAGNAQLFFQPSLLALPPDGKVNVWVTADKPTHFVRVDITFDQTKVKLAQEITLNASALSRNVKLTSMSEANSTGKLTIAVAVEPANKSNAPTGSFSLATLTLSPLTTANTTASLNFNSQSSQLVDLAAVPFLITAGSATVTLNPVASPSPLASLIASPTPVASPVSTDLTLPTISITYPTNGDVLTRNKTINITANAADNMGVSKVVFMINGSLKCTDTSAPYSCSWKPAGKSGSSDTITVGAYDAAGNKASQTINVIKK